MIISPSSSIKTWLFLTAASLYLGAGVQAQTTKSTFPNTQTPPRATSSPQETLKFAQQLMDVYLLCYKPLEWNETNASIAEVVADARKTLGDEAPAVEVRTKDSPRSTFQLKAAPLGRTLSSVATLANATLWVLPGRLLISTPEALTPSERAWVSQGMGGEWKGRTGSQWDAMRQLEKATVVVVGAEVKERLNAKAVPAPTPSAQPREIAFTELSPATQQHLLVLLKSRSRMYIPPRPVPVLDSSVIVVFNDSKSNSLELSLSKPKPGSATEREILGSWQAPDSTPVPTK